MATFTTACRLSTRLVKGQLRHAASRGFRTSSIRSAAHNLAMPAMSPTMTEGNIAKWNVKEGMSDFHEGDQAYSIPSYFFYGGQESIMLIVGYLGDSYSTGDVLLEIETDKANMDVEAQDDGIMAKIIETDGAKGVQVGTRIAVTTDAGDDLSTLEIPLEDKVPSPAKEEAKSKPSQASSTESSADPTPEPTPSSSDASTPSGPGQNPAYPLYPSVMALLHENHVPDSDVEKIPASGPKGRLLKGDVLSYLGTIGSSYSSEQSSRIEHMSHLDLSNIKIAPSKSTAPPKAEATPPLLEEVLETITEVTVPISLSQVLATQKRILDTLGVTMPLSTFIARATEIANEDLPLSKTLKLTSDDLFNSILGLDKLSPKTGRGTFVPQITALPPAASVVAGKVKRPDIIDMLTGTKKAAPAPVTVAPISGAGALNIFSVVVPKGEEEKRAKVFLERVKTILQVEPGRLVL